MDSLFPFVDKRYRTWLALNEEQLQQVQREQRRMQRYSAIGAGVLLTTWLPIFALTVTDKFRNVNLLGYPDSSAVGAALLALFVTGYLVAGLVSLGMTKKYSDRTQLLEPLSSSPAHFCSSAAGHLATRTGCVAWRDAAIAQGRQLRRFDVAAMDQISQAELLATFQGMAAAEEAHKHELCRKVHGLEA